MFPSNLLNISTTSRTLTDYDIYDVTNFKDPSTALGSSICNSTYSCVGYSFLPRNCFCDEICRHLEDCCWDNRHRSESFPSQPLPPKDVFSCLQIPEIHSGSPLLIVNKCPSNWDDTQVSKMCGSPKLDNLIERITVTDIHTGLHFKNIYCALCNYVTDYIFWKPELTCKKNFHFDNASQLNSTNNCAFQFNLPGPNSTYRTCRQYDIIDTCREANNSTPTSLVHMCTNGGYAVVYGGKDAYKNIHCALCNGLDENILQCNPIKPPLSTTAFDKDKKTLYSYRLLVDLNIAVGEKDGVKIEYRSKCSAGEIYDPFENQCITVYCYEPFVFESGKCSLIKDSHEIKSNTTLPFVNQTCPYVLLKSGTFEYISGKNIKILSTGKIYNETEYRIDGNQTFVCADISKQRTGYIPMFAYEEVTITLAGEILSLFALLINFVVYSCFHQLRNIPGKMLMSLIAALFVANFLFLVSSALELVSELCIAVAIVMHYFFLASFCWMNILDFDLWWTFSRQFTVMNSNGKSSKRFCFYSAYAWTLPFLIVIAAVSVNFANIETHVRHWQPNYGAGVCWIRNREALILFFIGPLMLFKLFDIVAFSATAVHIYRARNQSAMVQNKNSKCKFLIYIKLSLIMGLTWVFAFISNMAQIPALWYVFIALNTLQGVFICLCFVCTWKVFRLLSARARTLLDKRRKGSEELISCTASKSQSGKTLQTSTSTSSQVSV
ncbi:hypothetical protein ACJMK2_013181 [Sinanodonta woodiana]|uniref:G-protein coupled receptors family 2 profile 2 domain-containing protein n=1 Tax=Sinanodonta woodiana TaxID=1069815 RepID=A0ABD3V018_SINWO